MSDHAEILVAIDCAADAAAAVGETALAWLIEEGIVRRDLIDSVLGGDDRGYPPGPNMEAAVEHELVEFPASTGIFLTAAEFTRAGRAINGLEVVVGRTVFDAGGYGIELECPACGHTFEPGYNWYEVIDAWWEGDDDAPYACPSCGFSQPVREWDGPWPWGLGYLGFTFWNWPPLRQEFVRQLHSVIRGRLRLVKRRI